MSLAAISYPIFEEAGPGWIDNHRAQYDPAGHELLKPHFTFIHPQTALPRQPFIDHVAGIASSTSPVAFNISGAILFKTPVDPVWYAFLVPDRGYHDLVELHDELYTGDLQAQLRRDIPYVPHVTVGRFRQQAKAEAAVARINSERIDITGTVGTIEIVDYSGTHLEHIARVTLSGGISGNTGPGRP